MFRAARSIPRGLCGLLLWGALVAQVPASASPPGDAVLHDDCWDVVSFIEVPVSVVRPHVPARFRLQGEASGVTVLFIRSAACESMVVRGVTRPTTFSHFAALVEPLKPRANICAAPGAPQYNLCSWYVFETASDNAVLVGWVRERSSIGANVLYVPDMSFRFERIGATLHYSFNLPAPASSQFTMEAVISAADALRWCDDEFCLWVDYYFETPRELVHIGGASDLTSHAGEVEITPGPGTLMAEMFNPLSSRSSGAPVTYNRWDSGIWTKAVIN